MVLWRAPTALGSLRFRLILPGSVKLQWGDDKCKVALPCSYPTPGWNFWLNVKKAGHSQEDGNSSLTRSIANYFNCEMFYLEPL